MTALVKYESACRALAECKAIDEVKEWVDKAAAMQAYSRMAKDKTLEIDAAEIRIRAERRLRDASRHKPPSQSRSRRRQLSERCRNRHIQNS